MRLFDSCMSDCCMEIDDVPVVPIHSKQLKSLIAGKKAHDHQECLAHH